MSLERARLCFLKLPLTSRALTKRRDDQSFPVRRDVELGVLCDPQELEDRLVEDEARAGPNSLKSLDHPFVITPSEL